MEGVQIVGGRDDILSAVEKYDIDEIYFAISTASPQIRRDILNICKETKCELKRLPGMYQLANGDISLSKLKPVAVEDLLGRDPIKVNMDEIFQYIKGKTILVTGGGGSIGSKLCRQIAAHEPKQLIIFDVYENNAYEIEQELKRKYKTSLDEFPQFFNVLRGDMSIIGTRPPLISETNLYELHHRARLEIKPGTTGMRQVSGRSDITDFEEVVRLDKEYITNWNIGLDRIHAKTEG